MDSNDNHSYSPYYISLVYSQCKIYTNTNSQQDRINQPN